MDNLTLSLLDLFPVAGCPLKACFDNGLLSSDADVLVLVLSEIEKDSK